MSMNPVSMPVLSTPETKAPDTAQVRGASDEKLKEISQEFESLFFKLVLDSMRNAVPEGGLIEGGNAERIYRGMLDGEYAKVFSQTADSELGTAIYRQLSEMAGKTIEAAQHKQERGRAAYQKVGLQD